MEFIMKISNNVLNQFTNPTIETRPAVWRDQPIYGYYVSSNGHVFCGDRMLQSWMVNGRNYVRISTPVKDHSDSFRIDYLVAYTFLGHYTDSIRLVHIDEDIANDNLTNIMWYRKCDVIQSYIDMAIIESDGTIKEEWRLCKTEYNPDLGYEVSNLGQIRDAHGNRVPIREINTYLGFFYLDIYNGKRTRMLSIHRAVAEAFIPNPNNYDIVNHLDGDKFNNMVTNLEWSNSSMNMEHSYLQDLNMNAGYTERQIHRVCKLLQDGKLQHVAISRMTGVDRKTVSDIYRGRRWQQVSQKYNFAPRKWTDEIKQQISDMIIKGMKGQQIYAELGIPYDQAAISLYERTRRELKRQGKI